MKKTFIALFGVFVAVLTILQVPKFVSGAQDRESILQQIDTILEDSKFEDKAYSSKIQKKAKQASSVLTEGSIEQLVMLYISAKLKNKVSYLERLELVEAQREAKTEAQKQIALAQGGSQTTTELAYQAPNTNPYFKQAQQLDTSKQEHQAAPTGDVGNFNLGKKEAPKKTTKQQVSYATPEFKYKVGGFIYDKACVQLICLNTCMNKLERELPECRDTCVSSECLDSVKRTKGGISKYEIDFKPQ